MDAITPIEKKSNNTYRGQWMQYYPQRKNNAITPTEKKCNDTHRGQGMQ